MKIKKILVSQPKPASDKSPYYEIAQKHGVEVVFRPFIKVEGLTPQEVRKAKVSLGEFNAAIFTARTAVDHFFRLCKEMRITVPDTFKYFCTSESIALYLQKYTVYRKRKIFYPESGKIEDLIPAITKAKDAKILYAVAENQQNDIPCLENLKANTQKVAMYRTVSNDFAADEPFDYDMLIFFSPHGIEALKKNFPNFEQGDVKFATYGETTAKAVEEAGYRVDLGAPTPKAPSMPVALDQYLTQLAKAK